MRVSGRDYADRRLVRCFECERTIPQLASAHVVPAFLRCCGAVDCRVLLCAACYPNHLAIHELAGDKVVNPWKEKMQ